MNASWVEKTSGSPQTIKSVIDPILEKYGFGDTSSSEALQATYQVASYAYQAAANAIAKEQPYCQGMTLYRGLVPMELRASEAALNVLCATGIEASTARTLAENFYQELEAACNNLAAHYKPKGAVISQ